jgi:GTP-binding protein
MNTPIVALIGQPNVGKSSLFNLLAGKKSAIVSAKSGVTRDRQFAKVSIDDVPFWLVDTAGLASDTDKLSDAMYAQTRIAAKQADLVILMVDGSLQCTHIDIALARDIQKTKTPTLLVINKLDKSDPTLINTYRRIGMKDIISLSCITKSGLSDLQTSICDNIPHVEDEPLAKKPVITIVGKPNAGKSTLSNHYAKEDRCIVSHIPGTTRDAISMDLSHKGVDYTLIDTAGMRRKARIHEEVEQYATQDTLRAIDDSHTIIHLLDAQMDIARQDFRIIHLCLDLGKSVVIAINKIDCLNKPARIRFKADLGIALPHLKQIPVIEISATDGRHTHQLMKCALDLADSMQKTFGTAQLTRILERTVKRTPPPSRLGRPINLRVAHISRQSPLEITIRGKRTSYLPTSYTRYLVKSFTQALDLHGRLLQIKCQSDHNPFDPAK